MLEKYLYQTPIAAWAAARRKKKVYVTGSGQWCGVILIENIQDSSKSGYAFKTYDGNVLLKNNKTVRLKELEENGYCWVRVD